MSVRVISEAEKLYRKFASQAIEWCPGGERDPTWDMESDEYCWGVADGYDNAAKWIKHKFETTEWKEL